MILDAHTHVFPPEICSDRGRFLPGEEDFALIYENPAAKLVPAEELVGALARWGADGAVTFGFPFTDMGKSALCNDYVIEAAKRHPGTLVPFACVNPALGRAALKEVERSLANGARGVGELATYKAGLGEEVRRELTPIAHLCREAGVPLLLHANEPIGHKYAGKSPMEISDLYEAVKASPGTTWILAHMGGGLFSFGLLKKEVPEMLANVHYDISAAPFLFKPGVYRAFISIAGVDKLLFGTDYPLLELDRYRRELAAGGVDGEELEAIMGGNLARLLGMNG